MEIDSVLSWRLFYFVVDIGYKSCYTYSMSKWNDQNIINKEWQQRNKKQFARIMRARPGRAYELKLYYFN